jgi:deoxyribonuclease-4
VRFGVHVSIQGSFAEAPRRAAELGCDCFQIFAGPPRNWTRRVPRPGEADRFREERAVRGLSPVVVHAGYLLHLVSRRRRVARASRVLFRRELEIAAILGADYYVMHLGSGGASREAALEALAGAIAEAPEGGPVILLENSASLRSAVGARFEDIAELLRRLGGRGRHGVALDTAHAVGAGYDLTSSAAASGTLRKILRTVGAGRVKLVHANDARVPLGSGRDRHEGIGKGTIGREGFRSILADRRLRKLPFILETPVERAGDDRRNLALIRRLSREAVRGK